MVIIIILAFSYLNALLAKSKRLFRCLPPFKPCPVRIPADLKPGVDVIKVWKCTLCIIIEKTVYRDTPMGHPDKIEILQFVRKASLEVVVSIPQCIQIPSDEPVDPVADGVLAERLERGDGVAVLEEAEAAHVIDLICRKENVDFYEDCLSHRI